MQDHNKLAELAIPLAEYLKENYHPHATIIVTETSVKIVEDVIGTPIK